jgi:hypothetical protein
MSDLSVAIVCFTFVDMPLVELVLAFFRANVSVSGRCFDIHYAKVECCLERYVENMVYRCCIVKRNSYYDAMPNATSII